MIFYLEKKVNLEKILVLKAPLSFLCIDLNLICLTRIIGCKTLTF